MQRVFALLFAAAGLLAGTASAAAPDDLRTLALPVAAVPSGGSVQDIPVTGSDLPRGFAAGLEHVIVWSSGPFGWIDEQIYVAPTTAANATLLKPLATGAGRAMVGNGMEADIHGLYLLTVLLPVQSTVIKVAKIHLGDEAFEYTFGSHSGCCRFAVTGFAVRAGRYWLRLLFGGAGPTLAHALVERIADVAVARLHK